MTDVLYHLLLTSFVCQEFSEGVKQLCLYSILWHSRMNEGVIAYWHRFRKSQLKIKAFYLLMALGVLEMLTHSE